VALVAGATVPLIPSSPPPGGGRQDPTAGAVTSLKTPPDTSPLAAGRPQPPTEARRDPDRLEPSRLVRWLIVLAAVGIVLAIPRPAGITSESWRLLAIFIGTIVGSIVSPVPAGAVVLLGVAALAVTNAMPPARALAGYADPLVWLVLCAFFISRGVTKTGFGRRVAFLFIRALGRRSLGLSYALVGTDTLLAMLVPSNSARAGGVIYPITRNLAEAYDSHPGPTARRLGAFLMFVVYQCDVVACAMFLTGQASNVLIARFATEVGRVEMSYGRWMLGAIVPGVVSLLVLPLVLFRLFPPEVTHTPAAREMASAELDQMGPMRRDERIMLAVFALITGLWMTTAFHHINYTVVALLGVGMLLVTRVLDFDDIVGERLAWGTFLWYGGLVRMAEALGESGLTQRFAQASASVTVGWTWWAALAALLLVYFYAHYAFASITAHATAMYTPFLVVTLGAGAPPALAVLLLAYYSNLCASLTHYGTTTAPIYFGAGYVSQRDWWRLGFIVSVVTVLIWAVLGVAWWKMLGWI
jgi:divalent anion:Na+ symporter, DASS family